MEIKINSLEDIHNAAKAFISNMGDSKVFAFYGIIFVLVRTSNPSSSELQMLDLADGTKVYEHPALHGERRLCGPRQSSGEKQPQDHPADFKRGELGIPVFSVCLL